MVYTFFPRGISLSVMLQGNDYFLNRHGVIVTARKEMACLWPGQSGSKITGSFGPVPAAIY